MEQDEKCFCDFCCDEREASFGGCMGAITGFIGVMIVAGTFMWAILATAGLA